MWTPKTISDLRCSGRGGSRRPSPISPEAVRLRPIFAEAQNNLGSALGRKAGRRGHCHISGRRCASGPTSPRRRAISPPRWPSRGEPDEATAHFSRAARLKPDSAQAHNDLGNALYHPGTDQGGRSPSIPEAVRLDPGFAEAHHNLGLARPRAGGHPRRHRPILRGAPPEAGLREGAQQSGDRLLPAGASQGSDRAFRRGRAPRPELRRRPQQPARGTGRSAAGEETAASAAKLIDSRHARTRLLAQSSTTVRYTKPRCIGM